MVKDDIYYKEKLVEDAEFIIQHMSDQTQESLKQNEVLLDSMMFRLIQISESAKNISDEYKSKHESIPWTAIYGLRNRIVHDYGNVDLGVVYNTLKYDIVAVKELIESV